MAFGIIHHFPGGTEKQYDATLPRRARVRHRITRRADLSRCRAFGRRLDRGGDPRFGGQLERVP